MLADRHVDSALDHDLPRVERANRQTFMMLADRVERANCGKLVESRIDLGQIMDRDYSYRSRTVCRRSSSGYRLYANRFDSSFKLSKLLVIVIQLLFLSSFCRGGLLGGGLGPTWVKSDAGRGKGRLMFSRLASVSNYCTKFYTAVQGETCASLRTSSGLSQEQIFEVNPGLDCKTLSKGQRICVEGIAANCAVTISVNKGPTNTTCASIAAGRLSTQGFFVLNPGISCPEASGNNNSWSASQLVCVSTGLGNLFTEYIGDSGLPITFAEVQPLYQKYSSVITHLILAFVNDIDANGTSTNGVFHPYWNSALTPAAAKAFKAANPDVRLLMSLGGPSSSWKDPGANATEWIDTAQASLTTIATDYSIDGIDIAYESFPKGSANFTYCVGTLIAQLKGNNTIGLATMAPAGAVLSEYTSIMDSFSNQIDYVNFQFYSYQLLTVDNYIAEFDTIAYSFPPWKLLASTQIGGTKCITGPSFLEAVEKIQLARGLPGVMMFDVDHSVGNNFQDENLVLSLLNGEPYKNITNSTSLGPALAPSPSPSFGAPKSPVPSSGPAQGPLAPGSSKAPAPGATNSSQAPGPLAPGSSKAPAPGATNSSQAPGPLAPGSSKAPALGPGAPHSGLTPGLAPGSSLAPGSAAPGSGSGAPGSSPPVGSAGAPGSSTGNLAPQSPSSSSAPKRLLKSRAWSSQGFGLLTAILVLLLSWWAP